jgi:hypothetical protein
MIEFIDEFKAFSPMAVCTFLWDGRSMRIFVAGLAIRFFIGGRHIFKNLIAMACGA